MVTATRLVVTGRRWGKTAMVTRALDAGLVSPSRAWVPVTPTTVATTRAKGNAANDVPRAPHSSGHATVAAGAGPGSNVTGTETLTSAVSCGNGSGKEDPSARARGESNGSHPRVSGPVPSSPCNPPYEEDPVLYGFGSPPSDFDTATCEVVSRYIHRVEVITGPLSEDPCAQ